MVSMPTTMIPLCGLGTDHKRLAYIWKQKWDHMTITWSTWGSVVIGFQDPGISSFSFKEITDVFSNRPVGSYIYISYNI